MDTNDARDLVREGGCACGRLRFRTRGEPVRVGLCHCMTCRKTSGSVFVGFAIYDAERVVVEGEARPWSAAGHHERFLCPVCGAHVFGRDPGDPEIELRLGAFDEPNVFAPTYEAWVTRRESWLGESGLTLYQRNRSDG